MVHLGVNIDHVATVRQARRIDTPDPVEAALLSEAAGCHGITAHLREDRRHIQDHDVYRLKERIATRLNLELAFAPDVVALALSVCPEQVTLVPEKREEITTEGGLDVRDVQMIQAKVQPFLDKGIEVSLFVDPDPWQVEAAAQAGVPCIELHTGAFAEAATPLEQKKEIERLAKATQVGLDLGLKVNAGHGLNYHNVAQVVAIPGLYELNIGHSIVGRALMVGMQQAVADMLVAMEVAQ